MIRIIVKHSLTKLNNKRYKQQQFLLSMIGKISLFRYNKEILI